MGSLNHVSKRGHWTENQMKHPHYMSVSWEQYMQLILFKFLKTKNKTKNRLLNFETCHQTLWSPHLSQWKNSLCFYLESQVKLTEVPNSFHWKKWSWKFYPAAQNLTSCKLFWNMHTFKTISLQWKSYHPIYRSSIFSAIQQNNQQSARNTSNVLALCTHA